jgi:hypothetical protein
MLAMALQLKVVLAVIMLHNLRDRIIEVLSHHKEDGYLCWLVTM